MNLCKSVLSSALLGYPTPNLIHWSEENENTAKRIPVISDYLQNLKVSDHIDLVLIADGFEHWFQLSPQILVDRYHAINRWENEAIQQKARGNKDAVNIKQSIIFNSEKRCWPFMTNEAECAPTVASPFPKLMYEVANGTLVETGTRQVFLDSNFIVGPVDDMRMLFERANAKLEAAKEEDVSELQIFQEIWAEQEEHRRTLLDPSLPASSIQILRSEIQLDANLRYDFGIGLDYTNALFPPPAVPNVDYPLDFLNFANETLLRQTYELRSVSIAEPIPSLHPDIASDKLPFASLADDNAYAEPKQGYLGPSSTKWSHVPMFTDLWTGITPVIIPQSPPFLVGSASNDDLDMAQEMASDRARRTIWFLPLARKLLDAILRNQEGPVAVEGKLGHGKMWFGGTPREQFLEKGGFGVRLDGKGGGVFGWNEFCDEDAQTKSFRDGQGPWYWSKAGYTDGA